MSANDPSSLLSLSGKRAVVMGLGLFGGGVAAARFLARQGASVLVTDLRDGHALAPSVEALAEFGDSITFRLGEHLESDFAACDLLVKNPAVRMDNAYVQIAANAGAQISSEMNLFIERCKGELIGVTGSNGKTTTTHLLDAILREHGERTDSKHWLGGNLGRSLLDDLEAIKEDQRVLLELSSFQLMDLDRVERSPSLALVTNITPNHLDWHADMAEYVRAKSSIFRHAKEQSACVLNADDPITSRLGDHVPGRCVWYSLKALEAERQGVWMRNGVALASQQIVADASGGEAHELFRSDELKLPGPHNLSNALGAAAGALLAGASVEAVHAGITGFAGVEHRLEYVDSIRGVRFYNDSIATTPESTIAALRSFHRPIWLLLGGSDKGLDYTELANEIAVTPHLRVVYVNGPVGPSIADAIHQACRARPDPKRALRVEQPPSFDACVERAAKTASEGAVFLMSPATASFYEFAPGQKFKNFEHRGQHFKALVAKLKDA